MNSNGSLMSEDNAETLDNTNYVAESDFSTETMSSEPEGDAYDDEDDEEGDEDDEDLSWVEWFCSLPGHDVYCQVEEEFIDDDFNLTGLNAVVPYFCEALEMIQDVGPDGHFTKSALQIIEASAELLYALIHQRYILTKKGGQQLYEKYKSKTYGVCSRTLCEGQHVLPVGLSDLPNKHTMKVYCPRCMDVYHPSSRQQSIDGCAFGTTASHSLIMNTPELLDQVRSSWQRLAFAVVNPTTGIQESGTYIPRIYGFKIHKTSPIAPKMQWLRTRTVDTSALEAEVADSIQEVNKAQARAMDL